MAQPRIKVTDHALIRYLDRVGDYDIEEIRRQMVTKELRHTIKLVGNNGKFPVGDGKHVYVISDGTIVSVVPKS